MANTVTTSLENQELHSDYELIIRKKIASLMAEVIVSRHIQTGALHYHLAHDSDENSFLIAFRTQPMNSKGTAHVLEHTALCGSQKYPVRDPFFSMIKRSLQTFMNAFTASDWTAYPFATQNSKDFENLLSVYLDAVFFPNLHPLDFAQEGIRVELNADDYPEFKGIVFNEMKGAMSGEIDQLYQAISTALHQDTTYHYNSGGDPEEIPNLTHEELLDFHQEHYHPSNAIIMSFGNRPLQEIQKQCHEQALSQFSKGKKFSSVPETRMTAPIEVTESYAVDEITEQQTHHVLAWLLPKTTDCKQRLIMRLIEGILTEHAGSPLTAKLESSDLGTSPTPILGLDDNHYEMAFYAGLRGSEPENLAEVSTEILDTLKEVASKPIDRQEIDTVLHQIELTQRHIGGDGMPYGLTLLLEGLAAAIHDGDAIEVWDVEPQMEWLHEQLEDENWLPQQIQTLLIDNPHRVNLTMVPDAEKAARLQAEEDRKLSVLATKMADTDKAALQTQAKSLSDRQEAPDNVSILPKVDFTDIPVELEYANGNEIDIEIFGHKSKLYRYSAGTNGLYYAQVMIPLSSNHVSNPLMALYITLLSELGTSKHSSTEFQAIQAQHSGGISTRVAQRTSLHSADEHSTYLVLSTYALDRKLEALDLLKLCIEDTQFTDLSRVRELLSQKLARWQSRLMQSAHAYAIQTANSSFSQLATADYTTSGVPAIIKLKERMQEFKNNDQALEQFLLEIKNLHNHIMQLPKEVLVVAEDSQLEKITDHVSTHWQSPLATNDIKQLSSTDTLSVNKDTAWLIQTNVYHHALSFLAVSAEHEDTPALMVLGGYLQNNYLHRTVREQGGAYGVGAGYDSNACTFRFYSYRDPRVLETYKDFHDSVQWLMNSPQNEEWLEEAIMGLISNIDKPGSPAGEAIQACFSNLHGRTSTWQSEFRKSLLTVTIADLQHVAQTYLVEQDSVRVSFAPHTASDVFTDAGFDIQKMPS